MKHLPLLALLLLPTLPLHAQQQIDTSWLPPLQEQSRQRANECLQLLETVHSVLDEFQAHELLQAPITSPDMPPAQTGKLVAVCDGGMVFDAAESRLIYLRNVRLNENRLRVRASQQLVIQLKKNEVQQEKEQASDALSTQASEATTPASEILSAELDLPPSTSTPATSLVPEVAAPTAIVDMETNRILLTSASGQEPIRLTRGSDEILVETAQETPASAIADEQGNIYFSGSALHMTWADSRGQISELHSATAQAYYSAQHQCLVINGPCELSHPQGKMTCEESLCILFGQTTTQPPSPQRFMSQFSGMHFDRIQRATATGNVHAYSENRNDRPNSMVKGDLLHYNGLTGQCLLLGEHCEVIYGAHSLKSSQRIELKENGDILLLGDQLQGTYSRASQCTPGKILTGTFTAREHITFTAAEGIIRTEKGFHAQDDEALFTSDGPIALHLDKNETSHTTPPRHQTGMINLAIAQYTSVARLQAWDNVKASFHGHLPGRDTAEISSATGDFMDVNYKAGTVQVTADPGHPAALVFAQNTMTAISPETTSTANLLPNGDMDIKGSNISATLQSSGGLITATCSDSAYLDRQQGTLTTGENAAVHSPSGIVTATGSVRITLARKDSDPQHLSPQYTQLTYPYDGVSHIRTEKGGTIRTEKASMQCSGLMEVELDPSAAMTGDLSNIIHAEANGNVAVLGKDPQGKFVRATGDRLELQAVTGTTIISGGRVTLSNEYNTHTAYGPGASVRLDRDNNARITGSRQVTHATNIPQQMEERNQNQQ